MIVTLITAQLQKVLNVLIDLPMKHVVVFGEQIIERPGTSEDGGGFRGSHFATLQQFTGILHPACPYSGPCPNLPP